MVGVEGDPGRGDVVAAHRVGEVALAALGGPLHRPAQGARREAGHRVLGIEERLHPEPAADVGRDHPHLLGLQAEVGGEDVARHPARPGCRSATVSLASAASHSATQARGSMALQITRLLISSSSTTWAALANAAWTAASSPWCQSKARLPGASGWTWAAPASRRLGGVGHRRQVRRTRPRSARPRPWPGRGSRPRRRRRGRRHS